MDEINQPDFAPIRIELTSGIVTDATVHNSEGVRRLPSEIGKRKFYVSVVEADDNCVIVWDGEEYGAAIIEAETTRAEWGISAPVHDLVAGGAS